MSIKLKVAIFIVSSFVIVLGAFFFFNQRNQESAMNQLYDDGTESLKYALSKNIELYMMNGENEAIQPAIEHYTQEGIFHEITVVDGEQQIARSTSKQSIGKKALDEDWKRLFKTGQDFVVEKEINDEPMIVSYKLYSNSEACSDCHDIDSEKILGGLKIVKSKQAMVETMNASSMLMIIFGLLGGALCIAGILWYTNRHVFKPINKLKENLNRASVGDFNQEINVKSHDEIGNLLESIKKLILYVRELSDASDKIAHGKLAISLTPKSEKDTLGNSFVTMKNNLSDIVRKLTENTKQLVSVSTEVAAASEESSMNAKSQTHQISQIASAIEEMSATIIETSRNTADASQIAHESSQVATEGKKVVAETIHGMQNISDVVKNSAENIENLSRSAEQIGEIISVIDDIADQTNLLALNAAIEAARAGDQGRGFAVVADEVRKLAERTGKATGEITNMIKGIQVQTSEAVQSMEQGIKEVDNGRTLADQAGDSLDSVVQMSAQVLNMIEQIATASEQQSAASEEIAKNIEQITNITVESEVAFEQSAASAHQLDGQASSLQEIVNMFELSDSIKDK